MIDTDKYEGHTEGKWDITVDIAMEGSYFFRQGYDREQEGCDDDECDANARLMSDAPLLLAEVKRLRGIAKTCLEAIEAGGDIRSGTIELIEHNLKLMEMIE